MSWKLSFEITFWVILFVLLMILLVESRNGYLKGLAITGFIVWLATSLHFLTSLR